MKPSLLLYIIIVLTATVYTVSAYRSMQTTPKKDASSQLLSDQNISLGNVNASYDSSLFLEGGKDQGHDLSVVEEHGISASAVNSSTGSVAGNESQPSSDARFPRLLREASISTQGKTINVNQTSLPFFSVKTPTESPVMTGHHFSQVTTGMTHLFPNANFGRESARSTTMGHDYSSAKELRLSELCDEMVNFVMEYDLCNQNFTQKPFRSCRNRCGEKVLYHDSSERCSCDKFCSVYGDCCLDFSFQCPELFSQRHAVLDFGVESRCSLPGYYKSIASCTFHQQTLTTPVITYTYYNLTTVMATPWYIQSGLAEYEGKYNTLVGDLSTGLVYENEHFYLCNKGVNSVPYLVPYILPLTGTYEYGKSIEAYVFPNFHIPPFMLEVKGIEFRSCFQEEVIMCEKCLRSDLSNLYLQDVCELLASKEDTRLAYRRFKMFNNVNILNQKGSCSHTEFTTGRVSKLEWSKLQTFVKVQRVSLFSKEYILEFEGSPLKRIRCSNANMLLDDCDIEECSAGFWPGDKVCCFQPGVITVEFSNTTVTPICSCLMVYTAVQGTTIWKRSTLYTRNDICEIHLPHSPGPTNMNSTDHEVDENIGHIVFRDKLIDQLIQKLDMCDDVFSTLTLWFGRLELVGNWSFSANLSVTLTTPHFTSTTLGSPAPAPMSAGESILTVQCNIAFQTILAGTILVQVVIWGLM